MAERAYLRPPRDADRQRTGDKHVSLIRIRDDRLPEDVPQVKVIAVVQARMGSTRLPGKVMREVGGKPLLGYLFDSIADASEVDGCVVATPARDCASPIVDYALERGVCVHSSRDDEDVAGRIMDALDNFPKFQCFLRICADSPLLSPRTMNMYAWLLKLGEPVVSNVGCPLIPSGQHIEGAHVGVYRAHMNDFTKEDREHAGFPFFYREWKPESTVVDTEQDFQRVARIIECRV